jgi:hypothetical protein
LLPPFLTNSFKNTPITPRNTPPPSTHTQVPLTLHIITFSPCFLHSPASSISSRFSAWKYDDQEGEALL